MTVVRKDAGAWVHADALAILGRFWKSSTWSTIMDINKPVWLAGWDLWAGNEAEWISSWLFGYLLRYQFENLRRQLGAYPSHEGYTCRHTSWRGFRTKDLATGPTKTIFEGSASYCLLLLGGIVAALDHCPKCPDQVLTNNTAIPYLPPVAP